MIRILSEIFDNLIEDGFDIGAKLGERYVISSSAGSDNQPVFYCDPPTYVIDYTNFDEEHTLDFVLGMPTNQDEQLAIYNIERIEKCQEVLRGFILAVIAYENADEQQILRLETNPDIEPFFDYTLFETPITGLRCKFIITKIATNRC